MFLNEALIRSVIRYPYLNNRLEYNGKEYILTKKSKLVESKRITNICDLDSEDISHIVFIGYKNNSLYVLVNNLICTNYGIKPFIETLIYYYCQRRYRSFSTSDGINLAEGKIDATEEVDVLDQINNGANSNFIMNTDALELARNKDINKHIEISFNRSALDRLCQIDNTYIENLFSLLMSRAISKSNKIKSDIVCNIESDVRDILSLDKTYKNTLTRGKVLISKSDLKMPLFETLRVVENKVKQNLSKEQLTKQIKNVSNIIDRLDFLSNTSDKNKMLPFIDDAYLKTFSINSIGEFELNKNEIYIDKINVNSKNSSPLNLSITSFADKVILEIQQHFNYNDYINNFLEELRNLNIDSEYKEI